MSTANILIVEDDSDIREGVRILLESEGYGVEEAEDGFAALKRLSEKTDLVILDVMMPGISGIKTCEEIRKRSYVPGGDDYLSKPFSYAEQLGRVKALLRRYQVYRGKETTDQFQDRYLELGGIKINLEFNEVSVAGKTVELSNIEYNILLLMMKHPRRIFSAQQLYEAVWEEPYFYHCGSTVMVHISKLRAKIEKDDQKPRRITTIWGKGYRFEPVSE